MPPTDSEAFDPTDWERVDAVVSLGTTADQDVTALGEALSAAVRDIASTAPDDGRMAAADGPCPSWPLRAVLLRQPIGPTIEAQVIISAARTGQDLPPRLLAYYMGLLMRVGVSVRLVQPGTGVWVRPGQRGVGASFAVRVTCWILCGQY